jgi:small subunit ribosomal protein S21
MYVTVRDNNVDQALRALKKKLQREGVYREMKMRRFYEKPSERRARDQAAAIRRARKMDRKRMERDGLIPRQVMKKPDPRKGRGRGRPGGGSGGGGASGGGGRPSGGFGAR